MLLVIFLFNSKTNFEVRKEAKALLDPSLLGQQLFFLALCCQEAAATAGAPATKPNAHQMTLKLRFL